MKKLFTLLTMLVVGIVSSWADTQSYTVTYELTSSGRNYSKYYRDNSTNTNNWCNRWEVRGYMNATSFNDNIPGAYFYTNGYCISAYDSKLRNDGESNTFTISAIGSGIITGYTITANVSDTRSDKSEDFTKTITPAAGGDAVTWTTSDNPSKTVTVTGVSANTATFTLSGTNHGEVRILPTSFTMTMQLTILNSISDINYDKYYYLACPRGGLSTNDGELASTFKNDSYTMKPFAFVYSSGNYYLYSIEDRKFVSESGTLENTPSASIEINTTGKASDKYPTYVKIGTKYLRTSAYNTNYGANTGSLSTGDAGNYYAIIEGGSLKDYYKNYIDNYDGRWGLSASSIRSDIDEATSTAEIISACWTPLETIEGKFYKLSNYSYTSKYMYVTGTNVTTTETADDALMQFRFLSDGSIALFGGKNQKYVGSTAQSTQAVAVDTPISYDVEYNDTKGYAFHYSNGNYRAYLHCASSQSYNVVGWSNDAAATWWSVTEVDAAITYIFKENDVEFLRTTRSTTVGTEITALPSDLLRAFTDYEYPSAPLTTVAGENEFVANVSFTTSADYETATWYYATLRGKQLRADDNHKDGSNRYQTNSVKEITNNVYKWAFIGNPYDGIYVMNKGQGNGKYLYQATVPTFQEVTDPTTDNHTLWEATPNSNGGFTLRSISGGSTWYINDVANSGNLGVWNDGRGINDGGSNWVISDVILSNSKKYKLATSNRGSLSTYTSEDKTYLASPVKTSLGIDGKDFAIIEYNDKFYLYSVDDEKFVTYQSEQVAPIENNIVSFNNRITFIETTSGSDKYAIKFNNSDVLYINSSVSYTYGIAINDWGGSGYWDDGNQYTIVEAGDFDATDAITALDNFYTYYDAIDELNAIPWGLNAYGNKGKIHYYNAIGDYRVYAGNESDMIDILENAGYSDANLAVAQDILANGYALNLPTTEKFYRIKGYSNNYMTSNTASSNASMNGTANANNIIYYSKDKNLIFYGSGLGMYNTSIVAPVGSTFNTYTFNEGVQSNHYFIKSNYSGSKYCYDNTANGTKVDRNGTLVTSGNYETDWTLEEVTSLPVTFNSAALGYATFFAPVPLQVPSNTTAYICKVGEKEVDDKTVNTLTFYQITNITTKDNAGNDVPTIPANTPVLLYNSTVASSNVTVDFPITSLEYDMDATYIEGSFGTLAAESFDDVNDVWTDSEDNKWDIYSLRVNSTQSKVGFYKKTTGTTLAGFKAWLKTQPTDDARNFVISFDGEGDPTGIVEALGLQNDNVEIYDLNGRKLSSYKKGINIVNGKKVMIQ